jgi:lysophospholipase L1-like esterase
MSRFAFVAMLAFGLLAPSFARAAEPTPLKDGDRIVFLGDSITAGGARPEGYISMIRSALEAKHKDKKIECIGAGISGNKVPNLQARVEKDVVAKKPTIVVIYIGINDVWHGENDPARGTMPDAFVAGLKEVVGKIKAGGARVILCTPTVIGEKKNGANKLDAKLDQYADLSRGLAKELDLQLIDLRKAFVDHLTANNPEDKDKGILTPDRVHLNKAGNQLVADTMLKTLDP